MRHQIFCINVHTRFIDDKGMVFPVKPKTENQLYLQWERTRSGFGVWLVYIILSCLLTLKNEYEKNCLVCRKADGQKSNVLQRDESMPLPFKSQDQGGGFLLTLVFTGRLQPFLLSFLGGRGSQQSCLNQRCAFCQARTLHTCYLEKTWPLVYKCCFKNAFIHSTESQ